MSYRSLVGRASIAGAALWLAATACVSGEPLTLDVEVRARAVAPGEPLRVVITTPVPLTALDGEFLGEALSFSRGSADDGEAWVGWAMVALDGKLGNAVLTAYGTAADGRPAAGSRELTVVDKAFPIEQLSVAPKYVKPPPEVEERLVRERAKLAEIYRSRDPIPPDLSAFTRPVPGEPTSIFGTKRVFNGEPRSPHPGLDLRATTGTEVRASGPGRVVMAQELYYSGNIVIVDHGGGLFTLYAHLSEILVEEGQPATAGLLLGLSGATGRVTGPHLHWGAKLGNRPFDPTALLEESLFR